MPCKLLRGAESAFCEKNLNVNKIKYGYGTGTGSGLKVHLFSPQMAVGLRKEFMLRTFERY